MVSAYPPHQHAGIFRADIEGLRGIAILMVVLCHAGVGGFRGGFAGVDVFFVISGFLITGLLSSELARTGRIDLWVFYARRIRRLLPAFVILVPCVLVLLAWLAPGTDSDLQAESGFWAALWSSNNYFALADFDYFEASAQESLFLHTWSLGVEEQFYFVWPALLALVWQSSSKRALRVVTAVVCILAMGGFAIFVAARSRWPIAAYYLMPFRLWELALGGACALAVVKLGTRVSTAVVVIGIGLIMAACSGHYYELSRQGGWMLLPVVGAALVLVGGRAERAASWLACTPLTFVGRISYGWYLWHWPALALVRRLGHDGVVGMTVAVLGSFVTATLSYAFIERVVRRQDIRSARPVVLAGVLGSLVLALLCSHWRMTGGGDGYATIEERVRGMVSAPVLYRISGCDEWFLSERLVPCEFGAADGRRIAVAIGDSVGLQWFPALDKTFTDADWKLVVLTKSSCPVVDEQFYDERTQRTSGACDAWRKAAIQYIRRLRPSLVIMGSSSSYSFSPEQWAEGTRRVAESFGAGGSNVVILAPSPRLPFDGPGCVVRNMLALQSGRTQACGVDRMDVEDHKVVAALERTAHEVKHVAVLNLNDLVCPEGRCSAWVSGQLVYRDSQHLNAPFILGVADSVATRIRPYMTPSDP